MNPSEVSLQNLIRLLDLPDTDYWSDVGSCEARTVLDHGGEELLQSILNSFELWPNLRLEHLAYILASSQSRLEVELLSKLASSADPDIAFAARDSLRSP